MSSLEEQHWSDVLESKLEKPDRDDLEIWREDRQWIH